VLNPYGVLGFPSARYNPLAHLDPAAPSFVSDCERLAEGLVELRKGDHWELSALDYVTLLLMWVVRFDTPKTLTRVWQLLGADDATRQDLCLQMQACAYAPIAERAGRYTSDRGEVADSIQTARAQCVVLGDPAIQALMQDGPGALRFANLKRRPLTIFLIIPPELLHTRAKFLRLLVMAALGELIREPTQPPDPVLLLLDEFAQLGPLPMIENAAAIVRDYKLRLWIILQNLPQLQDLYGNRWESFLSSAGVVQVFTPNDMTTAGYFAKRAGQQPHWPRNIAPLQAHISYSEQQQPLYTEQDLLGLLPDKQLLFHYGQARPQESWRFPYLPLGDVDPTAPYYQRYAGTYDPDPYHLDTAARAAFVQQAPRGAWHLPCPAGRQEGVTRGCRRRGAQGAASRRPRRQPHTEGR
jgi:type IV secretion system protein VirD4